MNDIRAWRRLGANPVPVCLYRPQTPNGLALDRIRASAIENAVLASIDETIHSAEHADTLSHQIPHRLGSG